MFVIDRDNLVVPFVFNLYMFWISQLCSALCVFVCWGLGLLVLEFRNLDFPVLVGCAITGYSSLFFFVLK